MRQKHGTMATLKKTEAGTHRSTGETATTTTTTDNNTLKTEIQGYTKVRFKNQSGHLTVIHELRLLPHAFLLSK